MRVHVHDAEKSLSIAVNSIASKWYAYGIPFENFIANKYINGM